MYTTECARFLLSEYLTNNIKHDIEVTRTLGFQYLWVDSLSIVQDDPQNWELESVKMAEVHSRASLTLAAPNSASSDEGFLKLQPTPRRTVMLPFQDESRITTGCFTVADVAIESEGKFTDEFLSDVHGSSLPGPGPCRNVCSPGVWCSSEQTSFIGSVVRRIGVSARGCDPSSLTRNRSFTDCSRRATYLSSGREM
jgi:hypothetical protein